jgi:hypothetical protein
MNIRRFVPIACAAALALATTAASREPSPAGAEVYIVSPKNGAKVKSPVTVVFGLKGMGVAPAGIKFDNTGHHHLLIDSELPTDLSQPWPPMKRACTSARGRPRLR